MPSLDSPWFEQVGQAVAAVTTARSTSSNMTETEMDDLLKRVAKPTLASKAKVNQSWKLENSFMETGRHSWAKMELFEDVKKCMWTQGGGVKKACKLRPFEENNR
ncbi:uncharacterized protein LOC134696297 [Mytilus trossulus]|uniref:uncharacterized protein LOC134696297 n=1 Tax=Mytilus trossulus TaxID=6551 RepID=UPI0030056784